jgi:hypothetical protein
VLKGKQLRDYPVDLFCGHILNWNFEADEIFNQEQAIQDTHPQPLASASISKVGRCGSVHDWIEMIPTTTRYTARRRTLQ